MIFVRYQQFKSQVYHDILSKAIDTLSKAIFKTIMLRKNKYKYKKVLIINRMRLRD